MCIPGCASTPAEARLFHPNYANGHRPHCTTSGLKFYYRALWQSLLWIGTSFGDHLPPTANTTRDLQQNPPGTRWTWDELNATNRIQGTQHEQFSCQLEEASETYLCFGTSSGHGASPSPLWFSWAVVLIWWCCPSPHVLAVLWLALSKACVASAP